MPLINLTFDSMNISAQVGDILHYSHSGLNVGGFDSTALGNTVVIGPIVNIIDNTLSGGVGWTVTVNHINGDPPLSLPPPAAGDYISFSKDKTVNTSSLVGYYANVKFVNDSNNKVELFSVGSEISESSK
tara:strand:- start:362 stop:751 length:390 start_codon:yes stop_codon:yes gene_type:complete